MTEMPEHLKQLLRDAPERNREHARLWLSDAEVKETLRRNRERAKRDKEERKRDER